SATLKAARALSMKYGVPTLIHMAETQTEAMTANERGSPTVVSYLDALGFLGPGVVAAHAVWVNDTDMALLKARGVGVSHNPESNMKLASGIAPVKAYLASNVAIGLGTDGAASNNDLDMFEAMRAASFLQKVATMDPTAVSAKTAVQMATIGGARALGMERQIGSLEAGKRADVIIVRMSAARQTPMYDPISHLVYVTRGDDVQTTIVNGRVLMQNRKLTTLNEAAVLREANVWAGKVRAAVGR
ncbi:MAG TPA: amidohydrolase family protein, partial [Vicinamibacterales bacterium]